MRDGTAVAAHRCLVLLIGLLITATVSVAGRAMGHEKGDTVRISDATGDSARDTVVLDSARTIGHAKAAARSRYVMPPLTEALLEHAHNKIVHFPIVLTLGATLLLWLHHRTPEGIRVARLLIWAAAATAIVAYFTGQAQLQHFEGEPKEWLTLVHRKWGIATALALLGWAGLAAWRPAHRLIAWWGLGVSILIGIVAFLGGLISHG